MKTKSDFQALFMNGVYEGVLKEILESQKNNLDNVFYLQPHSGSYISKFRKKPPCHDYPKKLYASTTKNPNLVQFEATIVGWLDKISLFQEQNLSRQSIINDEINTYQPNEGGLYQKVGETHCANLLLIKDLNKLDKPFPVSFLFKTSNGRSLKNRTRAGGWSYVMDRVPTSDDEVILKSTFDNQLEKDVKKSAADSILARQKRLLNAPKYPAKSAVLSYNYNRNPDVIAEVISRANGICELCQIPAPFIRASDGSPYLEVHHWTPLAEDGLDTIENAAALCPNCHKQAHFGEFKGFIKMNHALPPSHTNQ
jgi:hypothetical protein